MNEEVESYPGELKELRSKVAQLENELMKYKPQQSKARVSGVPYEVDFRSIKQEVE